jgi:hypothetical protein
MSREIRRVPPGWEHPRDDGTAWSSNRYIPLLDDYAGDLATWEAEATAWETEAAALPTTSPEGGDRIQTINATEIFAPLSPLAPSWKYEDKRFQPIATGFRDHGLAYATRAWFSANLSKRPSPEDYVAYRLDEATHFQIYETVSEGTPVSPVFADEPAMIAWLIAEGFSQDNAVAFVKTGWAPSARMIGSHMLENIHSAAFAVPKS